MSDRTSTITLTGRPPVRVSDDNWPVIAFGTSEYYNSEYREDATRDYDAWISVRQHDDGRAVVYGTFVFRTKYRNEDDVVINAGNTVAPGQNIAQAISRVGFDIRDRLRRENEDSLRVIREAVDECIADLPPDDLD
jgi:hypothetical protein